MQMAALPAAGTEWFVRIYTGAVTGSAADANFAFEPSPRTAAIPGLRVQVAYEGASFNPSTPTAAQLERVHTVPDPYYVTNALEQSPNSKKLQFVNLSAYDRAVLDDYCQWQVEMQRGGATSQE